MQCCLPQCNILRVLKVICNIETKCFTGTGASAQQQLFLSDPSEPEWSLWSDICFRARQVSPPWLRPLRYLSVSKICPHKAISEQKLQVNKLWKIPDGLFRVFPPWPIQVVVRAGCWTPDGFWAAMIVTSEVPWLESNSWSDQQHNKSESTSLRNAKWTNWTDTRVDRVGLGEGIEGDKSWRNKICSGNVFEPLTQHFPSPLKFVSTIKCHESSLRKILNLKSKEIRKVLVSDFHWQDFLGCSNGIE